MSSSYYKMFKVPVWVLVQELSKQKTKVVLDWFRDSEALLQEWPANTYKDTVLGYANKGWRDYVQPGQILPAQLVMMSATEHVKNTVGITSQLIYTSPVHRLDRKMNKDEDYARLFNEILNSQQPIVLSQIFQVAERSHRERGNHVVWVTPAPAPKNILSILSDKVITVGEGDDCEINIAGVKIKELSEFLEQKFQELI